MTVPTLTLNVLLIEDSAADEELILRALMCDQISAVARRVDEPTTLGEALASAGPDIILSDYSMPGFGGPDALRLAQRLAPDVPFVFVSGTIGEDRAIQAIREGATDYVLKDNLRRLGPAVRRAVMEARQKAMARMADRERQRLASVLEATSDFVAMFDPAGRITYLNAAASRLAGRPTDALLGQHVKELYAPAARQSLEREVVSAVLRGGRWGGETSLLASDGSEVPVSQVMIAQQEPDGRFAFGSMIARDIRERIAYEARIRFDAHHDALTGLPNRTLLEDRASQALAHARRVARLAAMLVVDIDGFRLVNDTYGHPEGDRLLCWTGGRLAQAVGDGDTVARLGGDAFAVLVADIDAPAQVMEVARRISRQLASPFDLQGRDLRVSASIGAAVFPRDGDNLETLLRNADAAMHRAKAESRQFRFYADRMTLEMAERMELGNDLRHAIERRQVELHFQPQADLALNRTSGVEALLRWKHPRRGWIDPSRFIPIAEDLSLIGVLGDYALTEGCRRLREWDLAGAPRLRLAVNASARQLRDAEFPESVGRALERFRLDPDRLEIELTESVLLADPDETTALLSRLRQMGVRIAIDDFGTGYSSLSYLSRLPVDGLKIDRAFVRRIRRRGRDAAIVRAIISLGHSLGMRVVAEGVETPDELAFLRTNGCEEIQGFLYSRPLVPELVPDFARSEGVAGA